MKSMGRRTFLFGGFSESKENPSSESTSAVSLATENPIVKIGRISDFPIAAEKPVGDGTLLVESLPEGLRARFTGPTPHYYAITLNSNGELCVNRAATWPPDMVYSIMTGEPTSL